MNRSVAVVLLGLIAAVVVVSIAYVSRTPAPPTTAVGEPRKEGARVPVPADPVRTPPPPTAGLAPSDGLLAGFFERLQKGGAQAEDLDALRQKLLAMDPAQAAAAIREFLDSGKDLPTGQEFTVGEGGALAAAPTFRTFLLDVLGQVAKKSHTNVASAYSRKILEEKKSADEWALAMRNVAWGEPAAKPYLAAKVKEMLTYEPWRKEPSGGFYEAFDVAVYSGDASFVPQFTEMLGGEDEALRRASAVALDRLAGMAPLEVMNHLNANPQELADKPFLRADYYAKADLGNPAQRGALESYLARADVTLPEKQKLLRALATPAAFVSDNLITASPMPEADDGLARMKQLAGVFAQWQAQNKFPDLKPEMQAIQGRLGQ